MSLAYVGRLKDVWSRSISLPHAWLVDELGREQSFANHLHATEHAIEFLDDAKLLESMDHDVQPDFFGLVGHALDSFSLIEDTGDMTLLHSLHSFSDLCMRRHMDGAKSIREFFYGITPSCYLQRNPVVRTYDSDGKPQTTQSELDFAITYQQFGNINFSVKYSEGGITEDFLRVYGNYCKRCVSRDKHLAISPSHPALLLGTVSEGGSVDAALQHLRNCATIAISSMVAAWNSYSPHSALPPWAIIFGLICNPDTQSISLYAYLPTSFPSPGVVPQEVHVDEFPFRSYARVVRYRSPVRLKNLPIFAERLRFAIALLTLRKHIIRLASIWDSSSLSPLVQHTEDEINKAYSLYRPTPPPSEISSGDPFEEHIKRYFAKALALQSESSGQSEYEDPVDVDFDDAARAELEELVERWRQDVSIGDVVDPDDVPEVESLAESSGLARFDIIDKPLANPLGNPLSL